MDQSLYHILVDFSRSILTTACALAYYLGLSKKEDTKLDECTAIVTCSIGMVLSAYNYVLAQVSISDTMLEGQVVRAQHEQHI